MQLALYKFKKIEETNNKNDSQYSRSVTKQKEINYQFTDLAFNSIYITSYSIQFTFKSSFIQAENV